MYTMYVYYTLVESHLRYADDIWSSLSKAELAALQRLQVRVCSIIANARIKDNWSPSIKCRLSLPMRSKCSDSQDHEQTFPESLWSDFQTRFFHST